MTEHYKIIADEILFERGYRLFWDKPLDNDLVKFCAMSARNKYLTEEERLHYGLGRTEMYAKTVIRHDSYESFYTHVRRLECDTRGFVTKNGFPIPSKCMILYMLINPASTRKVINMQQKLVFDLHDELANAALKNSKEAIDSAFHKVRKVFDSTVSYYPQCIGERRWIDFDFDVDKTLLLSKFGELHDYFVQKLGQKDCAIFIDTHSGMHVCCRKDLFKFNPNDIIKATSAILFDGQVPKGYEIIRNENEQVPTIGTHQGGHTVSVLNLEDFS
jgi:hypothetical protein